MNVANYNDSILCRLTYLLTRHNTADSGWSLSSEQLIHAMTYDDHVTATH